MTAPRYLVLGASGMVGRAWGRLLTEKGIDHRVLSRSEFDLTQLDHVARIEKGVEVVVNCAAYTQVDQAETDVATANLANGEAVGLLAERCAELGAQLIHYSTDYVFDGNGTAPYPVDAPTSPVNAYGASKLLGERLLQKSRARSLLIRTSWVYAPEGKNFVLTIANLLKSKPELRVVDDQHGRPTSADELAKNSFRLAERAGSGVFHLTDGGQCSWFEFACEIKRLLGVDSKVVPCASSEYPRPAKRPAYSVLDLSRSEALIGPMLPWQEALARVIATSQQSSR